MDKYIDALPIYRQAEINARDGVNIDRATLCDWLGRAAWWLAPVSDAIGRHVMTALVIHIDDTPIGVLEPTIGRRSPCAPGPMSSTDHCGQASGRLNGIDS